MSNDNKCNTQHWDDLSPVELHFLIEKEQAFILHLKVTQDELLESLGKHQPPQNGSSTSQSNASRNWIMLSNKQSRETHNTSQNSLTASSIKPPTSPTS
ncbi:hypothetical protein QOT17_021956 [Balamuthia mandrillaris]